MNMSMAPTGYPLLAVDGLHVRYQSSKSAKDQTVYAVNGVSLEIARGETLGVVGESGSGKSTIARAVLGLAPIAAGTVAFDGRDVTDIKSKERRRLTRHIQWVPQDPYSSLDPTMRVGDIVSEPLIAHGIAKRRSAAARERVAELLQLVGLRQDAAESLPDRFSGGQRQRIAIARALAISPKLIIADEAVSALDVSIQAQICNLLRDLQERLDLSLMFVSHDLAIVQYVSSRVVVMYGGEMMESYPTSSSSLIHPYTSALFAAAPIPDIAAERSREHLTLRGSIIDATVQPRGCRFASRCSEVVEKCHTERPPLVVADSAQPNLVACWKR